MEADLARWFPSADLAAFDRGDWRTLSARKLALLVQRLPPVSAYRTRVRDEQPPAESSGGVPDFTSQAWDLINYQIQGLRDDIRAANWDTKESGPFKPLPYPGGSKNTPGDESLAVDELARRRELLEQVRKNRGWAHG